MGICYIFAAAPVSDYNHMNIDKQKDDYIICADGGLKHLKYLGLKPDLIVGDFDSLAYPQGEDCEIIKFPPEKDDTDMLIAIKYGLLRGYKDFILYGGLGRRIDHQMANIQSLLYLKTKNARGKLIDESHQIFIVSNEQIEVKAIEGYHLSLFSMGDSCVVTLKGVKYPLSNSKVTNYFPIGISNEFEEDSAVISIEKGTALIVLSKD
ncbi:MAG: thiamine pyrophosphokinae [Oscillospiraceae bacterium]|jgi:thiamine pyrophosphokinase|nr:thiamine pyrophosphokinae [Oscillospiraceae bacterium]